MLGLALMEPGSVAAVDPRKGDTAFAAGKAVVELLNRARGRATSSLAKP
jgi:dihydroxyacid dehydratase/phosphogluconate dehydratase